VRDVVEEADERALALVDAEDPAASEESVAQVTDRALDLALVLGPRDGAELRTRCIDPTLKGSGGVGIM
jgi:hypothetical protein